MIAILTIPPGRKSVSRVFYGVPVTEHYLNLQNGSPGVRLVTVFAGRERFRSRLADGESASTDLGGAFQQRGNEVLLIASGRSGGTVQVMLADTTGAISSYPGVPGRTRAGENWNW